MTKDNTTVLKVGHIADCHLCKRQYGYESRGADFYAALENAVTGMHSRGIRLALCAGDLIDTVNPGSEVCLSMLDNLRTKLQELGILMVVVSGNHDNADPHWCSLMRDTPAQGGICYIDHSKTDGPYLYCGVDGNLPPLSIAGRSYVPVDEYREWMAVAPAADVLMYHDEIVEAAGYAGHDMMSLQELADTGKWTLVAAGHIHKTAVLEAKRPDGRDMMFCYPGSTELGSGAEDAQKCFIEYTLVHDGTGWAVDSYSRCEFKTKPVQRFTIHDTEGLKAAIDAVNPGSVVFVRFDQSVKNVRTLLKLAVEHKMADDPLIPRDTKTILRMEPIYSEQEKKLLAEIRNGKCISLVEYSRSVAGEYFTPEENARGLDKLCSALLDSETDHRKLIDAYVTEQMGGTIVL